MRQFLRQWMSVFMVALLALAPMVGAPRTAAATSLLAQVGGKTYASAYAQWKLIAGGSPTATGTATLTLQPGANGACLPTLPDGSVIPNALQNGSGSLYTPIIVGQGTPNSETVTPTAVSLASTPCTITASFSNTHGPGDIIVSGDAGLDEAINSIPQGGVVVVDNLAGATSANINTANVNPLVSIEDDRFGVPRYWNGTPTGLALAAPTLPAINIAGQAACDATHQMCSDATVAGSASWGSTVYVCWAYVDIFGNEGPCSASTNWTSVASKAIDLGIPAASPGAVGAVPYLSLSGGTYAQAFQIPVTSTVCTMTTLETVTPACAVKNSTYNQAGSTYGAGGLFTTGGAQITTYPLNTSVHFTGLASTVQTTAAYTPMTNSSVTYAYAPGNRVGACAGISSYNNTQGIAAGGISASSTAAIPMALGTWTIPASCFNYIGAEFRVSGKFTWTEGSTSAATYNVVVGWDANGTDTTTKALALCTIANTHTPAAAAQNGYYSCTVKVLTTGATGTALVNGWGDMSIATGQALLIGFANDTAVAASGSINLTSAARITVQFFDSGNTVTGAQGLENTLEVLN